MKTFEHKFTLSDLILLKSGLNSLLDNEVNMNSNRKEYIEKLKAIINEEKPTLPKSGWVIKKPDNWKETAPEFQLVIDLINEIARQNETINPNWYCEGNGSMSYYGVIENRPFVGYMNYYPDITPEITLDHFLNAIE